MITKFGYDFSYIDRQDTQSYTPEDVMSEVREWSYILTESLHFPQSYTITNCEFSNRAKNYLAQTGRKRGSNIGFIKVNTNFLKHHMNPDIFHSVLCHETIHTLEGCFDHKARFKTIGFVIMRHFPNIFIRRTITDVGYARWLSETEDDVKNWKIVCKGCGQVIWRERACDITKHPERYKCGNCGDKFNVFHIENGMEVKYIHIAI